MMYRMDLVWQGKIGGRAFLGRGRKADFIGHSDVSWNDALIWLVGWPGESWVERVRCCQISIFKNIDTLLYSFQ